MMTLAESQLGSLRWRVCVRVSARLSTYCGSSYEECDRRWFPEWAERIR